MNELAPQRMTVEEYLDWAQDRPGRYELVNGRPVRMSPESTGHINVKVFTVIALMDAIDAPGLDLIALGDGAKLTGYFSVPSVEHYLVVDPVDRLVVHYRRAADGEILARSVPEDGTLDLSPPGLKVSVRRCFERK